MNDNVFRGLACIATTEDNKEQEWVIHIHRNPLYYFLNHTKVDSPFCFLLILLCFFCLNWFEWLFSCGNKRRKNEANECRRRLQQSSRYRELLVTDYHYSHSFTLGMNFTRHQWAADIPDHRAAWPAAAHQC